MTCVFAFSRWIKNGQVLFPPSPLSSARSLDSRVRGHTVHNPLSPPWTTFENVLWCSQLQHCDELSEICFFCIIVQVHFKVILHCTTNHCVPPLFHIALCAVHFVDIFKCSENTRNNFWNNYSMKVKPRLLIPDTESVGTNSMFLSQDISFFARISVWPNFNRRIMLYFQMCVRPQTRHCIFQPL